MQTQHLHLETRRGPEQLKIIQVSIKSIKNPLSTIESRSVLIVKKTKLWLHLAGQLEIFTALLFHQLLVVIPWQGNFCSQGSSGSNCSSAYLVVLVRSIQRPIFTLKAFMDWKSMVGLNRLAGGTWSSYRSSRGVLKARNLGFFPCRNYQFCFNNKYGY